MDFPTFQKMPKAEIHVHLEGSMRPARVLEWIAKDTHHPWHGLNSKSLVSQFQTASFPEFIQAFMTGYQLLNSADRYQQATEDLCQNFEEQGVAYAEVLYSPGVQIQHHGIALAHIHNGIARGLRTFPKLKIRFILDTVLNLGPAFMAQTTSAVLQDRRDFLAGFSIGGGVADIRLGPFLPLFDTAQQAGLFCVAHVGEVDPAENIHHLVANTDIQRIAHGCSAVENADVLAHLKKHQITIDVCPTSNRFTGASKRFSKHPAMTFLTHGIPMTLNTDDPLYFGCNLFGEYRIAAEEFGFNDTQLAQIMAHSLSFAQRNAPP